MEGSQTGIEEGKKVFLKCIVLKLSRKESKITIQGNIPRHLYRVPGTVFFWDEYSRKREMGLVLLPGTRYLQALVWLQCAAG